ncbi:Hypothetical protein CINCED_3A020181 [Cinara cedri]|uniref:Uncharacterized protein n=1 Tax=Cinara cedri TaxID=506608 RepID=A0A5E4NDL4_9HEMI|nr:Hypothetical protein CINCED_3A020181 [Cinara cedri]
MSSAILDIQCVLRSDNKYQIKEMSIVDTDTWATQHWIFKHTATAQDEKSRRTNKWLEHNYHQMYLEFGDIPYDEISRILNSLKFDHIYIKGEQKRQLIQDFIPQVFVSNMEDMDCPRLDQLCDDDNLPCCIFHMNLNPKYCTFYKVYALRKWFVNNS